MTHSNLQHWARRVREGSALAVTSALAACRPRLRRWLARGRAAVVYGEVGQSMVEYALVAALVAVVCMIAIGAFGTALGTVFSNMTAKITGLGR